MYVIKLRIFLLMTKVHMFNWNDLDIDFWNIGI